MKKTLPSACVFLIIAAFLPHLHASEKDGRLNIFVSIVPQKYFVEQIAGDRVKVNAMVKPGAHPAAYEPAPRQMAALSDCDIYFSAGVPFEKAWMKKIRSANPDMKIAAADAWIEKLPADRHDGSFHEHGHSKEHGGGSDPHTWLSPPLVMIQARHIAAALSEADPDNAGHYRSGFRDFVSDIAELDAKLLAMFAEKKDSHEFIVFHPSWGYFADAYGLRQIPVEAEGKSPKSSEIQKLITHARQKGIKAVLVQPQISSRTAEMIAREIGGKTVTADPLAENWAENLLEVAASIRQAAR